MTTYKNQLEMDILQEDNDSVVTYSQNYSLLLCSRGRNFGPYQNFEKESQLTVPYSVIKFFKEAREMKIRELYIISAERPDTHPAIRSSLNLWGFQSLIEYIYTIAELGFLEGLVPVLDLGLLLPAELNRLKEITSVLCVHLLNTSTANLKNENSELFQKKQALYINMLNWTGKLEIPTKASLQYSDIIEFSYYDYLLESLAKAQESYDHIHEITIIPQNSSSKIESVLKLYHKTKEMFPDLLINLQFSDYETIKLFIDEGIKDVGTFHQNIHPCFPNNRRINIQELHDYCESKSLTLQQRFPIRKTFIESSRYSEKLGQIFDAYRYKIKKTIQEKKEEKHI